MKYSHNYWMRKAIEQAELGKTPYGAVIVKSTDEYISAFNTTTIEGPQAHAEMNVIKKINELGIYNSKDLKLYTTVEPCPMCMSAIIWAGIGHVIYGANIDDAKTYGNQIYIRCQDIADNAWFDIEITPEVEREDCLNLLATKS